MGQVEIYDICRMKDSQHNASASFCKNCLSCGVHVLRRLLSRAVLSRYRSCDFRSDFRSLLLTDQSQVNVMSISSQFHGDFQIFMQLSQCLIRVYLTVWSKNFFSYLFFKTTVLFLFFLFSLFNFIMIIPSLCCRRRAYFNKLPYFL